MKVLFFAQSRQSTNCSEYLLKSAHPLTQSEFWAHLIKTFPNLAPLQKTTRLARNETYLQSHEPLYPHDEIALIPPVSGG